MPLLRPRRPRHLRLLEARWHVVYDGIIELQRSGLHNAARELEGVLCDIEDQWLGYVLQPTQEFHGKKA
jgi:hypothetical protein